MDKEKMSKGEGIEEGGTDKKKQLGKRVVKRRVTIKHNMEKLRNRRRKDCEEKWRKRNEKMKSIKIKEKEKSKKRRSKENRKINK